MRPGLLIILSDETGLGHAVVRVAIVQVVRLGESVSPGPDGLYCNLYQRHHLFGVLVRNENSRLVIDVECEIHIWQPFCKR